jgi:hypothetical protein
MLNITRRTLILWALILTVIYSAVSFFVEEPPLINLLNGVFFGVSVAVAIVYAPLFIHSIHHPKFDRVSQLSIGIGLVWLSLLCSRLWTTANRYYGNTEEVVNSPITGFIVFMAIVGGSLFVTAPGYTIGPPPSKFMGKNRNLLVTLAAFGGLLTTIIYLSIVPHF